MKARNNKTGETVTHFSVSEEFGTASYIDSEGKLRFSTPFDGEWTIIDDENDTLDSFRAEAAKDFVAAMLTNHEFRELSSDMTVKIAIDYADKLIKHLCEKDENEK